MSSLTWDQAIALQHRPLSPERLRAEMLWAEITGKTPMLAPLPQIWWTPPAPAPAPRAPRGRGKRQQKPTRPVLVETRRNKLLTCPDGRVLACTRLQRSTIAV
jgi:hypothetical protein